MGVNTIAFDEKRADEDKLDINDSWADCKINDSNSPASERNKLMLLS